MATKAPATSTVGSLGKVGLTMLLWADDNPIAYLHLSSNRPGWLAASQSQKPALASELTDDDLAAIAAGAKEEGVKLGSGSKSGSLKLN